MPYDELVDSEYRSRSVVASDVQILVLYFSKMFPEVLDREMRGVRRRCVEQT